MTYPAARGSPPRAGISSHAAAPPTSYSLHHVDDAERQQPIALHAAPAPWAHQMPRSPSYSSSSSSSASTLPAAPRGVSSAKASRRHTSVMPPSSSLSSSNTHTVHPSAAYDSVAHDSGMGSSSGTGGYKTEVHPVPRNHLPAGPSSVSRLYDYAPDRYTSLPPREFPQVTGGNGVSSDRFSSDRFISSQAPTAQAAAAANLSIQSTMRGRRAPAPAALDLRSDRPLPVPEATARVTDDWDVYVQQQQQQRQYHHGTHQQRQVPQSLPQASQPGGPHQGLLLETTAPSAPPPPQQRQQQQQQPPATAASSSSSSSRTDAVPFPVQATTTPPIFSTSPSFRSVPLAGLESSGDSSTQPSAFDPRASVASSDRAGANGDRVSIDSYYLGAGSGNEGLSPGDRHASLTPTTPDYFDPSNIDRRGLVGVGELATPRWGASEGPRHLRTPSMSHDFSLTPPVPPPFDRQMLVGSAPGRQSAWARQTEPGASLGLGVNVMEQVVERAEETPRKDRMRHRSVSHDSPARQANISSSSSQQGLSALDSLLSLSSLGDFSFDSNMETNQLAASLNMPEEKAVPSPPTGRNRDLRASAPPAPKTYTSSFTVPAAAPPMPPPKTSDSPQSASSADPVSLPRAEPAPALPPATPPGDPNSPSLPTSGSARERIYIRRASRQQAAAVAAGIPPPQMIDLPPLPVPKSSPPNSADSHTQTFRESRKTPPSGGRERDGSLSSKRRTLASPSHDILRHIAPKDFSHLPPSPSSASINQFLRGSNTGVHRANTTRTPPGSLSGHSTKTSTSGVTRSESVRSSRSRAQSMKVGEVAATAEALRKLDGLGAAPSAKKMSAGPGPTAVTPKPRPCTPPEQSSRRHTAKASLPALQAATGTTSRDKSDKESPISAWYEISHTELASVTTGGSSTAPPTPPTRSNRASVAASMNASDPPPLTYDQKARESSPSIVGTPTSRESYTNTPPLSTTMATVVTRDLRAEKAARRPSLQSELSTDSFIDDSAAESYVPPVPPLPRGYMSMRQGLPIAGSNAQYTAQHAAGRYNHLHPEDDPPRSHHHAPHTQQPATAFPLPLHKSSPEMPSAAAFSAMPVNDTPRTRTMSKKWSFSSALSLNKLHKEKEPPVVHSPAHSPAHTLSPSSYAGSASHHSSAMMSPSALTSSPKHTNESFESPSIPATPWQEKAGVDLSSPRNTVLQQSHASEPGETGFDTHSNSSVTPIAPPAGHGLAPPLPKSGSKRLTPSSIPFFRRASSSSVSIANKLQAMEQHSYQAPRFSVHAPPPPPSSNSTILSPTAGATTQRTPSGTRKSMLGMHIPAMLRGSGSKRGLSQQLSPQVVESQMAQLSLEAHKAPESGVQKSASIGRSGRPRGMTVSSGGDQGLVSSLSRKPSTSTHYSSRSEHVSNGIPMSTGARSVKLPSATMASAPVAATSAATASAALPSTTTAQQQTLHGTSSQTSLRKSETRVPPSATPTKIPRMASRPSVTTPSAQSVHQTAGSSMPPTSFPTASGGMTSSRSANNLASSGNGSVHDTDVVVAKNEFGPMTPNVRQSLQAGSSAHRAHLLAPQSTRKHSMSGIPAPPPVVSTQSSTAKQRDPSITSISGIPPSSSRRNLPQLPSSATAMTISAAAKARPVASVRNSPSTDETVTSPSTLIKSSKSFHSKAGGPGHSRLSLSSSVGGASGSRRQSLANESNASDSPADDEETLADAEMGSYVARRKTRAASASGSKKDDLSDLIGFPKDINPAEAISQRHFISRHLNSLSDYERKEVLDFDFIYYVAHNVRRGPQPDGKLYNHGYDDERGDYIVVEGDHLCYRYEVVGVLGKGSFGQVVHCRDHKTGGSVAVKIIRNKKRFHAQALVEVKILQQIVEWDPQDKHFMVKMTDHFYFRGHLCIVTELLSINLYELIKANQFCGFSTVLIRRFTTQMLASLTLMRSHRIVHCDLKPENILLRHPAKSGIKVIDFGSSCHESEKVYTYIQSRFYRSPEVILGMNYAMAIDMWSLGCILAELYTGYPIFPGENEHEQLACIMEVLGVPDTYIVQKASRRKLFFDATNAPRPFVNAKGKRRRPGTKTLASVLKCNDELFIDFISKCLTWDPDKRLKPQPAMRHPWILAGRRRQAPPPPERDNRQSFLGSSTTSTRRSLAVAAQANGGSSGGDNNSSSKKGLIISPPTPLVARVPQASTGASRIGVSVSSARLHARNSTYVPNAQKISMA